MSIFSKAQRLEVTPASVHYGHAQALQEARQTTLDGAFMAFPKRFKGLRPQPHALPTAVWINPPPPETAAQKTPATCAVNS